MQGQATLPDLQFLNRYCIPEEAVLMQGSDRVRKGLLRHGIGLALAFALLISTSHQAQLAQSGAPSTASATEKTSKADLHQALLDLTNPWTVMCVAAHPDDEDGSTLTVLRRKYGAHTVSLFSTYGEGGQNAVGPELYEELGVIRARETLAASAVQGSEAHFLGLKDFGFSKSAKETLRAWGEKETLRRMVFQIRKLRPDVIITNHNTSDGHGHHQATGRLILEAFDAAADSQQFPEQLSQVKPWQVQRLFVRYRGSQPAATGTPQQVVTVDPNEMDSIRGLTYAQQALLGLQQHATQGPWPKTIPATGGRISRYSLVKTAVGAAPLPADAKTPYEGLQLPEPIRQRLVAPTLNEKPLSAYEGNPAEILISLINAKKRRAFTAPAEVVAMDPQRFHLMSNRLDRALATAAGVSLTLKPMKATLVAGVESPLEVALTNTGDSEVFIRQVTINGLHSNKHVNPADKLLPDTETSQEVMVKTSKTASMSVPASEHLYDGRLFGEEVIISARLEVEGAQFNLVTETHLDVMPAVSIANNNPTPCVETPTTILFCGGTSLTITNHLQTPFNGVLEQKLDLRGAHHPVASTQLSLNPNESRRIVTPRISAIPAREEVALPRRGGSVSVLVTDSSSKEKISERTIPITYIAAVAPVGLSVAYIPSTDQTLQQALRALGVQAQELKVDDISGDLSRFDSIIIDNRGYEIHPELIAGNDKLLKFVEEGGTLIVFYHKTNEWNPDERRKRPQLAPYPIVLDDDRVTEEDAPVRILQPGHPLLNYPNKITQRDFSWWIQERGLYFPKEWDSHYTPLLSTNDRGEPPLNGGLLVAKYGKGNYIYTSMVWYRQLRAGIPGGYRFFANMISYGSRKQGQ
jgi:LmbE family N-acetylglucosaminyl deacetylase